MDLYALLQQLIEDGEISAIAANNMAQFGTEVRPMLGATLLPERETQNMFRENSIQYRTVIAQDGSRYSPVQKRGDGKLVGSMLVELGNSDIGREMTGQDYDALIQYLNAGSEMEAAGELIDWADTVLNMALLQHNERQRWQAIVDAQVEREGDNGYSETVQYPDPSGHRVAAGGDWSSDAYDPWDDITGLAQTMRNKGYSVNRIVTSTAVVNTLLSNLNVARRAGTSQVIPTSGGDVEYQNTTTEADLTRLAQRSRLPGFEEYNAQYWTEDGSYRYLKEDVLVLLATTGRDEEVVSNIDPEDRRYLTDTMGYTAVGRPVGQPSSGRVIQMEQYSNKPPRVEGEAWQTSLPVITEPEAIGVITGITTV